MESLLVGLAFLTVLSAILLPLLCFYCWLQERYVGKEIQRLASSPAVCAVARYWGVLLRKNARRLSVANVSDSQVGMFEKELRWEVARWMANPDRRESTFGVGLDRWGVRVGKPDAMLERAAMKARIVDIGSWLPQGAAVSVSEVEVWVRFRASTGWVLWWSIGDGAATTRC